MKRALLASVLISGALFGCATDGPPPKPDAPTIERPAPDYADLAARYNANASALDRLWSRVTVVLDATDAEGSTRRDQGEGHLQWTSSGKVASPRTEEPANEDWRGPPDTIAGDGRPRKFATTSGKSRLEKPTLHPSRRKPVNTKEA
ncbi:MAG: hypothetical protein AAF138_11650, partial [Planctomycetota bacterium]